MRRNSFKIFGEASGFFSDIPTKTKCAYLDPYRVPGTGTSRVGEDPTATAVMDEGRMGDVPVEVEYHRVQRDGDQSRNIKENKGFHYIPRGGPGYVKLAAELRRGPWWELAP